MCSMLINVCVLGLLLAGILAGGPF